MQDLCNAKEQPPQRLFQIGPIQQAVAQAQHQAMAVPMESKAGTTDRRHPVLQDQATHQGVGIQLPPPCGDLQEGVKRPIRFGK